MCKFGANGQQIINKYLRESVGVRCNTCCAVLCCVTLQSCRLRNASKNRLDYAQIKKRVGEHSKWTCKIHPSEMSGDKKLLLNDVKKRAKSSGFYIIFDMKL